MLASFVKLSAWFKGRSKLLLIIAGILVIAFGSIQTFRANKWAKEALRLDGKLEEQVADQDLLYAEAEKKEGERTEKEAEEREKREELEARIQKFKRDTEIAERALAAEKRKTAALPPTELVEEITERIGEEEAMLTTGDFYLFTRLGTERTLDRFKDGEFYLSEFNKFQGILADHEAEVESFNTSIDECEKSVATNLEGWVDCRETLATSIQNNDALKKAAKASVWRGRKQGAFWTIVIGGGLKLLGVW